VHGELEGHGAGLLLAFADGAEHGAIGTLAEPRHHAPGTHLESWRRKRSGLLGRGFHGR
jgi:hypothetical protein